MKISTAKLQDLNKANYCLCKTTVECWEKRQRTSVGVISPYTAQVIAMQERIGRKFEKHEFLSVTVKSIDGFQGGEEDTILISIIRSNQDEKVGFFSEGI